MIQVLIVEDDPMVAAVVKSYLRDVPDFQVAAEAGGVEEAKQHLKENKTIQLVLLDVTCLGKMACHCCLICAKTRSKQMSS